MHAPHEAHRTNSLVLMMQLRPGVGAGGLILHG